MADRIYVGVFDRVKATVVDTVVLLIHLILITYLFSYFENVPDEARIIAFIFVFFLYDPIFVSAFGGTIGHFVIGFRVKRENNLEKNILFPLAIVRFFFKVLLGWISLIAVSGSVKKKAMHDMIVRSVAVYVADEKENESE